MADGDSGIEQLAFLASAFVDGLTKADAEELKDAFGLFDKDGDGRISKEELGPVLRILGRHPTQADLDSMMKEADTDNSGFLSFEEYAQVIAKHLTPLDEVKIGLRQAFQVFDKDKSGYLNLEELQDVLCSVGDVLSAREAETVLHAVDLNNDKRVDVEEFVEFLCDKV
ncbi:neo-calmodulin-like isoform X2 [Babylonia areolata]|uniref:neo-calmodulin-like isoform X2 n=1 Tax=Babylonia areolata TaxID=304850 RepID=UPI003FD45AE9